MPKWVQNKKTWVAIILLKSVAYVKINFKRMTE